MEDTKPTTEKPKWLLKLEQESWQAELIISGIAIFGSLQLPDLIDRFGQWGLTYFSTDSSIVLWSFLLFLYFTSSTLIFVFLTHFVLRAIWIGLIGLNSVFPDGIKTEGGLYSKIFMEKFKAEYDRKNYGIESLDKFCSGIFGFCTLIILFSLTFTSLILIVYGIYVLLGLFFPSKTIELLGLTLYIVIVVLSILSIILMHKRFAKNEKLQNWLYKWMNLSYILFFHIFRQPLNYLTFLFSTNINIKKHFFSYLITIFLLYGFTFYQLQTPVNSFIEDQNAFHAYYARPNEAAAEIYEEYLTAESPPIFSATIPSKLIEGPMMNIFIPIFPNEETIYTESCGAYSSSEKMSREENKKAKRQYYANCYQKYHQIYINNQLQDNLELVKFIHPHRSSEGVITYIPTNGFIKGKKNILKVEKLMKEDSVYRTMIVPFWFGGE